MARDARLLYSGLADKIADRPLAVQQRFDDAAAGGIGDRLERIYIHLNVYMQLYINVVKADWLSKRLDAALKYSILLFRARAVAAAQA
jgi:hypothetical protein